MGLNPNQVLFIGSGLSIIALAVGYVIMPSDETKIQNMKKYLKPNQSYRPEVIQKMKDQEKSGKQFMDAIKRASNSDQISFGQKTDKKE